MKNSSSKQHGILFDRIAFAYRWFFGYQKKLYAKIISENRGLLPAGHAKILDIGCGTGAFSVCLQQIGYDVTGVDIAPKMVKQALKAGVISVIGDAVTGLDFEDKSFTLVTAAFVAHGLDQSSRKKLFKEAMRLATDLVIFQDLNRERHIILDIVEWFERSDYLHFIQTGEDEMREVFSSVRAMKVAPRISWYICRP
jgi:ubiquinone/menaquinone biosynthesis C-methylase UbiE